MSAYAPAVLDLLARAYDRALEAMPRQAMLDPETARAAILQAILDAARAGERDEDALIYAALSGMMGRPVGVAIDKTGALLGNTVWRVAPAGSRSATR
jgi:hypothetical protein